MKILQTITTFGLKSGGTTTAVYDLMVALNESNCHVDLMTTNHVRKGDRMAGNGEKWIKIVEDDTVLYPFAYSNNFKEALYKSDYDIYHANGMWMYCGHITAVVARKKNKKFVLTPHGMLYTVPNPDYSLKQKIFLNLFFKKDIMKADCIHATCKQEMEIIRKFGYKGPIAVIANAVKIPRNFCLPTKEDKYNNTIGYLGRLHPRKHVENIIYAISLLDKRKQIVLKIIGKGNEEYEQFLKEEAKRLDVNVEFLGFLEGTDKYELLKKLTTLCVPSDFENFGMIIPEALVCGTPVIASKGTPWEALIENNCGWWVDNTPDELSKSILEATSMSTDEIVSMGVRGRNLVESSFTYDIVSKQMIELYKWLNKEGNKPDFVYEG